MRARHTKTHFVILVRGWNVSFFQTQQKKACLVFFVCFCLFVKSISMKKKLLELFLVERKEQLVALNYLRHLQQKWDEKCSPQLKRLFCWEQSRRSCLRTWPSQRPRTLEVCDHQSFVHWPWHSLFQSHRIPSFRDVRNWVNPVQTPRSSSWTRRLFRCSRSRLPNLGQSGAKARTGGWSRLSVLVSEQLQCLIRSWCCDSWWRSRSNKSLCACACVVVGDYEVTKLKGTWGDDSLLLVCKAESTITVLLSSFPSSSIARTFFSSFFDIFMMFWWDDLFDSIRFYFNFINFFVLTSIAF